jgi:hypothetical protein
MSILDVTPELTELTIDHLNEMGFIKLRQDPNIYKRRTIISENEKLIQCMFFVNTKDPVFKFIIYANAYNPLTHDLNSTHQFHFETDRYEVVHSYLDKSNLINLF